GGQFEWLRQPAWRRLQSPYQLRNLFKKLIPADQACAVESKGRIVAGESLRDPQASRVVLRFVVERAEFHRTKALDVPRVEVLVAHERQPAAIGCSGPGRPAGCHQEG